MNTFIYKHDYEIWLTSKQKEEIYSAIKFLGIPYTVIDVGYWYQISFPTLPSGRVEYAQIVPLNTIHGDGTTPNILTDLRDVGHFVARIILDDRTVNRYIYIIGEELSENEIYRIAEKISGEKLEPTRVGQLHLHVRIILMQTDSQLSNEDIEAKLEQSKVALTQYPLNAMKRTSLYIAQYQHSKYVRQDNSIDYADNLGYVSTRVLYPDFQPTTFHDFFEETLAGKGRKVYSQPHVSVFQQY